MNQKVICCLFFVTGIELDAQLEQNTADYQLLRKPFHLQQT